MRYSSPLPPTQLTIMAKTFIRAWRIRRRMTLGVLGDRLGVTGVTVHRWESGKVSPTLDQLQRVGTVLDCSIMALIHGPEDVPIVGRVVSGGEVADSIDFPTRKEAPFIRCPAECDPSSTAALRLDTDTLFPFGPEWVAYFRRTPDSPGASCVGRLCVAQLASSGHRYVRRLRQGSAPGLYTLAMPYWPDVADAALDWASPIVVARPLDNEETSAIDRRR